VLLFILASSEHTTFYKLLIVPSVPQFKMKMIQFSEETKVCSSIFRVRRGPFADGCQERISKILDITREVVHYGYLPLIIYLGNFISPIYTYDKTDI
jgi:hypothetical protein